MQRSLCWLPGAAHAAGDAVALGVLARPAQDHRGGARAERQRGELQLEVLGRRVVAGEPLDRVALQTAHALGVDEQRVVHLAGVDERAGELDAVEEAEARVRDVEVEAAGGQPELVVHADRVRRLDAGPADGGVDQQPDLGGVDARPRPAPWRRPSRPRRRTSRPRATSVARSRPRAARSSRASCPVRSYVRISRCVELGRRHHHGRLDGAHGQHRGVLQPVARVACHPRPSPSRAAPLTGSANTS